MLVLASVIVGITIGAAGVNAQLNPNLTDPVGGPHIPGRIPTNLIEPLQQRLAFAGPGGMTVSWNTFAQLDNPTVKYGLAPGALTSTETNAVSTTYSMSRTYNNHVTLTGLKSGTKYFYAVSNTNCTGCTQRYPDSFVTALAAGDPTPFTAAVFVDLGLMGPDGLSTTIGITGTQTSVLGVGDLNTIESLAKYSDSYTFMLHPGDIGYADSVLKESIGRYFGNDPKVVMPTRERVAELYESFSEQFFDQMAAVTPSRPYLVAPGNHENNVLNGGIVDKVNNITYTADAESMPGQANFTWYNTHMSMPSGPSGGVSNMWYSFDQGLAHFVALNTETDLGNGLASPVNSSTSHTRTFGSYPNEQVDWLRADLAAVNRTKTPWVIAMLHRPWYNSANPPVWPAWQQAFEQIFYDNEVDLYIQGHTHVFERFNPIFNGTVDPAGLNNPRAPMVIISGAAGHYDGLDAFTPGPRANGSAFGVDATFGWGRLTVHNRTHLSHEYIASRNGSILDTATLYKAHSFAVVPIPVKNATTSIPSPSTASAVGNSKIGSSTSTRYSYSTVTASPTSSATKSTSSTPAAGAAAGSILPSGAHAKLAASLVSVAALLAIALAL